jgi:hypothetical protein
VAATIQPESGDEGELIAVLTAAISAVCGHDAVIRSFAPAAERTRFATPAWRMASIVQNSQGLRG